MFSKAFAFVVFSFCKVFCLTLINIAKSMPTFCERGKSWEKCEKEVLFAVFWEVYLKGRRD